MEKQYTGEELHWGRGYGLEDSIMGHFMNRKCGEFIDGWGGGQ